MNIRPLDDRRVVKQAEAKTRLPAAFFCRKAPKEKPTRGKVHQN